MNRRDALEDFLPPAGIELYLYDQWAACSLTIPTNPQHLRGVVISNMVASVPRYEAYVAKFKSELTPAERKTLDKYEAAKNYDAPKYQKIVNDRIYTKHICRLNPWPARVELSFRYFNQKLYNYLQLW